MAGLSWKHHLIRNADSVASSGRLKLHCEELSALFTPKERRKLASHIVAGLAPANHGCSVEPVARQDSATGRTLQQFHRPFRDKFILSADTSHFVAG